jgi:hypothetical protein
MGCALTLHVISPQSKITHRVRITGTKDSFNFSLYLQQPPETSHPSPVMSNRHAPRPSVSSSSPDPLQAAEMPVANPQHNAQAPAPNAAGTRRKRRLMEIDHSENEENEEEDEEDEEDDEEDYIPSPPNRVSIICRYMRYTCHN